MNKTNILSRIATQLEANISELAESLASYEAASNMDEGDTVDPDDFSKQTEYKEMQMRMQVQLDHAKGNLVRLNDLASKDHSQAEIGSLLKTDKGWFFLGLSLASMNIDGMELLGISQESPAYATIRGKQVGDSFMLGKNTYTIKEVF